MIIYFKGETKIL